MAWNIWENFIFGWELWVPSSCCVAAVFLEGADRGLGAGMWYRAVVLNEWVEILQAWPVLVAAVVREQIVDFGGDGW